MSYLVLARKWRPQVFDDVVGQDHVVHTIQNALNKDRLAHAFVFTGARGVGKTTLARLLAKAMQCENGPTASPCGSCGICKEVADSRCVDVLEIDGASNRGIDQVRELREGVRYLPQRARFKIVIIDEVHMLTVEAFNALLKTLEEPPAHVKFVFATTEPHRIPITILSRCQRFDFKRIVPGQIAGQLRRIATSESIEVDDEAVHQIARAAQGSMRDALSLFDQAIAYADGTITAAVASEALGIVDRRLIVELSEAVLRQDASAALTTVERAFHSGVDQRQLLGELVEELRHLVVARAVSEPTPLIDLPEREIEALVERAAQVSGEDLQRLFAMALDQIDAVARADSPRQVLDVLVARMASMPPYRTLQELSSLVEQLAAGGAMPGPRRPSPSRPSPSAPPPARSSSATRDARGRPAKAASSPRPTAPKGGTAPPVAATAAEAKSASSVADGPPTPAAAEPADTPLPGIDSRWQATVVELRSHHPMLASFLEHGVVAGVDNEVLTLRFEQAFYADAIKDRDSFGVVVETICQHYPGVKQVRVEVGAMDEAQRALSMAEAAAMHQAQEQSDREAEALSSPTVKLAVEIFGGTVLKVNEA